MNPVPEKIAEIISEIEEETIPVVYYEVVDHTYSGTKYLRTIPVQNCYLLHSCHNVDRGGTLKMA